MKMVLIIIASVLTGFIALLIYACCYVAGKADEQMERHRRTMALIQRDRDALRAMHISETMDELNEQIQVIQGKVKPEAKPKCE